MANPLKIEYIDTDELKPFVGNPRDHSERNINDIERSIKLFGWTNPIIVRRSDNMIVAGHGRVEAAQHQGLEQVPIIYVDMTENDAKLYSVADNRTSETSEWDYGNLTELLAELNGLPDIDLGDSGFDSIEVDELIGDPDFGDPMINSRPTDDLGAFDITEFQTTVKQLILYFDGAEYPELLERLDRAREAEGAGDNSQLFLKMLDLYEKDHERLDG